MLPPRILRQYFDFFKRMSRFGLDFEQCKVLTAEELTEWYQFHRHVDMDYSRVIDVDNISKPELKNLKELFHIHTQFQVRRIIIANTIITRFIAHSHSCVGTASVIIIHIYVTFSLAFSSPRQCYLCSNTNFFVHVG